MTCQDVSFGQARCRIEVEPGRSNPGSRICVARLSVVEDGGKTLRPVVFASGERIEVHGTSEVLALNSAMTYLERRLGAKAEPEFACVPSPTPMHFGAPFVLEDA